MKRKPLTFLDIKKAIIKSLTPDLLSDYWRALVCETDPPESGHCAIATEAFYYLAGGKEAGLMPVVCAYYGDMDDNMIFGRPPYKSEKKRYFKQTHWWVRGHENGIRGKGNIFDVTIGQYSAPFPYEHGRNCGFQHPKKIPSKRAQTIIDRVESRLGKQLVEEYRQNNIRTYQSALSRRGANKNNKHKPGSAHRTPSLSRS